MFFMPWPWGLRVFVCGFWGLFCFGLPGSLLWGLGWAWSGFLDCCTDWNRFWFCWFCLESLILAQDERWRRA